MTNDALQFKEDWFQHNIPFWRQWLGGFAGKPGLRALEIGSFEGRSTLWLCENILTSPDSRIDCVDFFAPDPVYGDYHARFRQNTAAYRGKIHEYAGNSYDMLKRVEGPYDIVYIDGWHSAFGAMTDGVMTWPMLRVGGVMIFDDYLWVPPKLGKPKKPGILSRNLIKLRGGDWRREGLLKQIESVAGDTPKMGVDALLATLAGHHEVIGSDYQLAVRKTRGFDQGQVGHDT